METSCRSKVKGAWGPHSVLWGGGRDLGEKRPPPSPRPLSTWGPKVIPKGSKGGSLLEPQLKTQQLFEFGCLWGPKLRRQDQYLAKHKGHQVRRRGIKDEDMHRKLLKTRRHAQKTCRHTHVFLSDGSAIAESRSSLFIHTHTHTRTSKSIMIVM